jgi:hypothetical protein
MHAENRRTSSALDAPVGDPPLRDDVVVVAVVVAT